MKANHRTVENKVGIVMTGGAERGEAAAKREDAELRHKPAEGTGTSVQAEAEQPEPAVWREARSWIEARKREEEQVWKSLQQDTPARERQSEYQLAEQEHSNVVIREADGKDNSGGHEGVTESKPMVGMKTDVWSGTRKQAVFRPLRVSEAGRSRSSPLDRIKPRRVYKHSFSSAIAIRGKPDRSE